MLRASIWIFAFIWVAAAHGEPWLSDLAQPPAPVYTSEVYVADVTVVPGRRAAFPIGIKSSLPPDSMLVSVAGMPQGARFSAGSTVCGNIWLLPAPVPDHLTIVLPSLAPIRVRLVVQLLDSSTGAPLSAKAASTVGVVGSPEIILRRKEDLRNKPDLRAETPPAPEETLIGEGNSRMREGDILAARQLYRKAAAMGACEAILAMGCSYDPIFHDRIVEKNAGPDAAKAFEWYKKAMVAGLGQTASIRIEILKHFLDVPDSPRPPRNAEAAKNEVEELLREGSKRMREGDVLEARRFYQKAVELGDPYAMLAMGRSYDPVFFATIEKRNAEPDAVMAAEWYRKASEAGAEIGKARIANLKNFLNK